MTETFEIREKVRCFTKFYDYQEKMWLPDEVLYFGESYVEPGKLLILWHGTVHAVPASDIYKIKGESE